MSTLSVQMGHDASTGSSVTGSNGMSNHQQNCTNTDDTSTTMNTTFSLTPIVTNIATPTSISSRPVPVLVPVSAAATPKSKKRRSIQWRLHLGLLPAPNNVTSNASQSPGDNNAQYVAARIIAQQRQHYQMLVKKHPFPIAVSEEGGDEDDEVVEADDTVEDKKEENNNNSKEGITINENSVRTIENSPNSESTLIKSLSGSAFVDPLTAIVQEEQQEKKRMDEIDHEYRKERAKHKRGIDEQRKIIPESEDYDVRYVTLKMLEKDLLRLPFPPPQLDDDHNDHIDNNNNDIGQGQGTVDDQTIQQHRIEWRKFVLENVLYIWACEYPQAGYLQGMHEVASYVLYAIELENDGLPLHTALNDILTTTQQHVNDGIVDTTGVEASTDNNDHNKVRLQARELIMNDPTYQRVCADTYTIMDCILRTGLQASYDLCFDTTISIQNTYRSSTAMIKPLLSMSQRILQRISYHDQQLGQLLTQSSIPIPLLVTKWVRVLFSREIDLTKTQLSLGGMNTPTTSTQASNSGISAMTKRDERIVLDIWDIIFRLMYEQNIMLHDKMSLQTAIECMVSSRFILHTHTIKQFLLPPQNNNNSNNNNQYYYQNGSTGTSDCLHWLMNIPLESTGNVRIWMAILKSVIANQRITEQLFQKLPKPPEPAPLPPQPSPQQQQSFLVNMTATSAAAAAGFLTQRMNPLSPSASVGSSTNYQDNQQQHQQSFTNDSTSPATSNNIKFSLLNIKDKIADKTNLLQKRIHQEWESFQQQQQYNIEYQQQVQQQQQQHYNQQNPMSFNQQHYQYPIASPSSNQRSLSDTTTGGMYNLDYHRPVFGSHRNDDQSISRNMMHSFSQEDVSIPTTTSAGNMPHPLSTSTNDIRAGTGTVPTSNSTTTFTCNEQRWANCLEQSIASIQSCFILMEQQRTTISAQYMYERNKVWESLADLQLLCNEVKHVVAMKETHQLQDQPNT